MTKAQWIQVLDEQWDNLTQIVKQKAKKTPKKDLAQRCNELRELVREFNKRMHEEEGL